MPCLRVGPLLTILGSTLLTACSDDRAEPTQPIMPAHIQAYVTGDAARSLGSDGLFELAPATAPADLPIIAPGRAGELASAYVRTYGPTMAPGFRMFGAPDIDIRKLQMSPRVFYAETPFARFPDVWSLAPRRHSGPYYVTHFLLDGQTALTVAVSAYAHDVQISPEGRIVLPVQVGGLFYDFPVTPDGARVSYRPVSPEAAVQIVAARAGARITNPPRLMLRDRRFHPVTAQWQLTLDRPVTVKRGSERLSVTELFVGPNGALSVPSAAQPTAVRVEYRSGPRPGPVGPSRSTRGQGAAPRSALDLPRRPGIPTEFEDVILESAEG